MYDESLKLGVLLKVRDSVFKLENAISSCITTINNQNKSNNFAILQRLKGYRPLITKQKELIVELQEATTAESFSRIVNLINELSLFIKEDAIKCNQYIQTKQWVKEVPDDKIN